MTIENIQSIVIILGWIISIPLLYKTCCDMCSYYDEIKVLKGRLSEFQNRMDDLEKTVDMNTYHICYMLNEAERENEA